VTARQTEEVGITLPSDLTERRSAVQLKLPSMERSRIGLRTFSINRNLKPSKFCRPPLTKERSSGHDNCR
jgi:hypothetical protein